MESEVCRAAVCLQDESMGQTRPDVFYFSVTGQSKQRHSLKIQI